MQAFEEASASAAAELEEMGAGELLLMSPVVELPHNVLDAMLQHTAYQRWLRAFLQPAQQSAQQPAQQQSQPPASTSKRQWGQNWRSRKKPPTASAAAAAAASSTALQQAPAITRAAGSVQQAPVPHVVLGEPHYGPFYRAQSTFYAAFMQYGTAGSRL
uniref:Uncharacterized protein n=1 Tax=Tetradesmus obliquus TaxID=3088 RepID=A0A383WH63_TETOB